MTSESAFVRACRGQSVAYTPVWFMRQAGRSLPEYRDLRVAAGLSMLETCRRPELVREITLQPVRRHNVDAAIFYSDIVVPVAAAGVGVEIVAAAGGGGETAAGRGRGAAEPIRTAADLSRVGELDPAAVSFVDEAIRMIL